MRKYIVENILLVLLLTVSIIIISSLIINRYNQKKEFDSFILFSISYLIYYFVIPFVIIFIYKNEIPSNQRFGRTISEKSIDSHMSAIIILFLSYMFILVAYNTFNKFSNYNNRKDYEIKIEKKLMFITHLIFVISAFSLIVIMYKLGGLTTSLTQIENLRSGVVDKSTYISKNFLFVFTIYTWIYGPTFLYYLSYKNNKKNKYKFLFFISLGLSVYSLLLAGGRMPIILFFFSFLYGHFRNKYDKFAFKLLIVIIIAIFSLSYLDDLFFYLSNGYVKISDSSTILSIVEEFSFPYSNVLNRNQFNNFFGLRYGKDLYGWITYLFPTKILSIFGIDRIEHGYDLITYYYNKYEPHRGGVPTDLITMGFRQFRYFGLLITTSLVSYLMSILDGLIIKINKPKYAFLVLRISMLMFLFLPYSDLENFIRGHFNIIFVIIIVKYSLVKTSIKD